MHGFFGDKCIEFMSEYIIYFCKHIYLYTHIHTHVYMEYEAYLRSGSAGV